MSSLFDNYAQYDADEQDNYFIQPAVRTKLLLLFNNLPIAVTNIDAISSEDAVMRAVAVHYSSHGEGHGRALIKLAGEFARDTGAARLCVNADPKAVAFYASCGFKPNIWSNYENERYRLNTATVAPIQMTKPVIRV